MEIIAFFVLFGATLFLQRWLQQHIQGFTFAVTGNPGCAVRALFLLLLPGVLLHEFSHWLVANVLGVRTGQINIGLGKMRGKHFSLGSVTIERTDPLRESLIGVAPFVFGILAIWLILGIGFALWTPPQDWLTAAEPVWSTLTDPLTWLALYLIFAVSTSMIPSESDREPWGIIIILFAGIATVAFVLGWAPRLSPQLIATADKILRTLILIFGIIAAVNGTLAVIIFVMEWGFGAVTQRKVRY